MKRTKMIHWFSLALFAIIFTACGSSGKSETEADLMTQISTMEAGLYNSSNGILDMVKADSMVDLYEAFVAAFPSDSLSPRYLFKTAELQMGMNKNEDCIATLSRIQNEYPDCAFMPTVLHFKAFVYDDKFQDYDKARACLDELIEKYPDDPLIPNAKAYRNMIGKDPNEVFKQQDSLPVPPAS